MKTIHLLGNQIGDEGKGALRAAKEVFSASNLVLMFFLSRVRLGKLTFAFVISSLTASAASATLLSTPTGDVGCTLYAQWL